MQQLTLINKNELFALFTKSLRMYMFIEKVSLSFDMTF